MRLEHSVCHESLMTTYILQHIYIIYDIYYMYIIYIILYIYIYKLLALRLDGLRLENFENLENMSSRNKEM